MLRASLALLSIQTVTAQFHLFFAIQCNCELHLFHEHEENFSIINEAVKFGRHFDGPVPEVNFRLIVFHETELIPVELDLKWTSHRNKTFFYNENDVFIVAHYFCHEGRCEVDTVRNDFHGKVNMWCLILVIIGVVFFLLMSGTSHAFYRRMKAFFVGRTPHYSTFEHEVYPDMNSREET